MIIDVLLFVEIIESDNPCPHPKYIIPFTTSINILNIKSVISVSPSRNSRHTISLQ